MLSTFVQTFEVLLGSEKFSVNRANDLIDAIAEQKTVIEYADFCVLRLNKLAVDADRVVAQIVAPRISK